MIWGKLALGLLALALTACVFLSNTVRAQSWGGLYDMNRMLNEPHPFAQANTASPAPPPFTPQPNASRRNIHPAATRHSAPARAPVTTESSGGKWTNIFSEIRIGLLMHDYGPFSSNEEDGYDGNVELLFASPDIFSFMWSPRPHLGVSYNSSGNTSQAALARDLLSLRAQHILGREQVHASVANQLPMKALLKRHRRCVQERAKAVSRLRERGRDAWGCLGGREVTAHCPFRDK